MKRQDCIEVRYVVSDGYVGGERPQTFMLCEEDLFDGQLDPTEEGIVEMIEELAYNDMVGKTEPTLRNMDTVVRWALARIEERTR